MDGSDFSAARPAPRRRPLAVVESAISHSRTRDSAQLEDVLIARGVLSYSTIEAVQTLQSDPGEALGDLLLDAGHLTETELLAALAECYGISVMQIATQPPELALKGLLPAQDWIACGAVPWRRVGSAVVIALQNPEMEQSLRRALPGRRLLFTLAPRDQIRDGQVHLFGHDLARLAEGQAPLAHSCRTWRTRRVSRLGAFALIGILLSAVMAPLLFWTFVLILVMSVFTANLALKTAALWAMTTAPDADAAPSGLNAHMTPHITILVPLFREREIASTLIANLTRLKYPRERLEVLLVTEADDQTTADALKSCALPPWMRVIRVPPGAPKTKPRALNFALNFARGAIVGIYDAEDRPEPDQLQKIIQRFAAARPDVACLQGRLDYYNGRHNALARFFTIEYASWFRVLLPGVQRLGLFVPLGGTSLFIKREVLQEVGGWDAHNVTEDAELGLRLTRHGYETELVDTTTFEEANAALLPWISQRSRWQKGYLMTWATAMSTPRRLLRDLGPYRFLGFQVQVLFAVVGFMVAPILWSFALPIFGVPHPVLGLLSPTQLWALIGFSLFGTVMSLLVGIKGTERPHLRHLRRWVPLTEFYYLLGALSAWRAFIELGLRPFWWSKTEHGRFGGVPSSEPESP